MKKNVIFIFPVWNEGDNFTDSPFLMVVKLGALLNLHPSCEKKIDRWVWCLYSTWRCPLGNELNRDHRLYLAKFVGNHVTRRLHEHLTIVGIVDTLPIVG